jgi:hypothetical protein
MNRNAIGIGLLVAVAVFIAYMAGRGSTISGASAYDRLITERAAGLCRSFGLPANSDCIGRFYPVARDHTEHGDQ